MLVPAKNIHFKVAYLHVVLVVDKFTFISQIEIPSAPFPGDPPVILLSPKPTLSAGDFEKKWLSMDKT